MKPVLFSLGSNLGDREFNLVRALNLLEKHIGEMSLMSMIYETEPWGFSAENNFYNACALFETDLKPFEILNVIKSVEEEMGRVRLNTPGYDSRIIDIDIIFYSDFVFYSDQLQIPHPLMHKRNFVLIPLLDIAPFYVHPLFNRTVYDLSLMSEDTTSVLKIVELN